MIFREKQSLREKMRRVLAELPESRKLAASADIRESLAALPRWNGGGWVFAFAPLPTEPDLLDALLVPGRRTAFPLPRDGAMAFHPVTRREELRAGKMGLAEPPEKGPRIGPEDAGLILVPGLAFDSKGGRLGRGGGYYDRFLAQVPRGVPRVGIAFREQLVEHVPVEPHDCPVDAVISA